MAYLYIFLGFLLTAATVDAATITTEFPDYAPGDTVVMTGTGWGPGETVVIVLHEDPTMCADHELTAIADDMGDIYNAEFAVDEHDVGVTFTVTATGLTSGLTAETTFTDNCAAGQVVDATCPLTDNSTCKVGCRWITGPNTGTCATQTAAAPSGTVCREATDVCDRRETCNGSSQFCPSDAVVSSATVCRTVAGPCDRVEFCTGTSKECPVDSFLPEGAGCRPGVGSCDVGETCSGTSAQCPEDSFKPAGTGCRVGTGPCDPGEMCTGTGASCPENMLAPAGTVCRPANGTCDMAEVCSGTSASCPTNSLVPVNTVCRAADGPCDVAEKCTGSSAVCPADGKKAAGTACGDSSATPCTDPDACNSTGQCLKKNKECAFVTSSSLCPFDVNPNKGTCVGGTSDGQGCRMGSNTDPCVRNGGTCAASNQFRLIFTPDVQEWIAYKLNASNPGQYFYNLVADGTAGDTVDLTIEIPYPFVTQGATPVHVYDGDLPISGGCFQPGQALGSSNVQIELADWLNGTDDGTLDCDQVLGPNGSGFCRFTVTSQFPASGQLYVNVHLDFGLKGPMVDANPMNMAVDRYDRGLTVSPWSTYDALQNTSTDNGPLALKDCRDFVFSHENESTMESFTDTVQNLDDFKRTAGVFGQIVASATGALGNGARMQLVRNSTGVVAASATADTDGFYMLSYKHKGAPALYTVYDLSHGLTQTVQLSGNGSVEVSFDTSTGTATVVVKK